MLGIDLLDTNVEFYLNEMDISFECESVSSGSTFLL